MSYSHLFFDLDDTLLDFKKTEQTAFVSLMAQYNLPFTEEIFDQYNQINRKVWQDLEKHLISSEQVKTKRFEIFCSQLDIRVDHRVMAEQYLKNLSQGIERIEGCEELLRKVNGKFNLVLITNGLSAVQNPRIIRSGIDKLFPIIVISEEVGVSKPSAEFFSIAWEKAGHPAKDKVLVIGDSLSSDIHGGINFGMHTCWYNPNNLQGALQPTYTIDHLDQLSQILGL